MARASTAVAWLLATLAHAHPVLAQTPAGAKLVVGAGEPEPGWLVQAREELDRGVEAYYEARFTEATEHLVGAMKSLTGRFEEHPVDGDLVERGAVMLILSLHALERDEEALEVAGGLAGFSPPPWGTDLDLAPDARTHLDEIAASLGEPATGILDVTGLEEACPVAVDGEIVDEHPSLAAGQHWVQPRCESGWGDHHLVEIEPGTTLVLDLGEPGPEPVEEADEKAGEELLLDTQVEPVPWYGDGWNLALQISGLALLGVGAGLLGGSIQLEERAMTTRSLGYAELEKTAFDMEVSGWVLLGTGAVAFTAGVIRMSRTGGEK